MERFTNIMPIYANCETAIELSWNVPMTHLEQSLLLVPPFRVTFLEYSES